MADLIEAYTKWAVRRSPLTPEHFHRNTMLTLIAGAIAGRCYVQLPYAQIYPNLYTLIVARTSVFAKTSSFNLARHIANQVMPEKLLESVSTPEAFFAELSGEKPTNFEVLDPEDKKIWQASAKWGARKIFVLDEAGMFFNSLSRDYNATLADIFMKLYDAGNPPLKRNTRTGGLIMIKDYALSSLLATTPWAIRVMLTRRDSWMNGFWNRWNFVSAKELTEWGEGEFVDTPKPIIAGLSKINNGWLCQYNAKPFNMPIDKVVVDQLTQATKSMRDEIMKSDDERFDGVMAHIPTKHLKAAIIYAILDESNERPRVQLKHWEKAGATLVNGWYEDAHQALEMSHQSERVSDEEKAIIFIKSGEYTRRDLQRHLHKSVKDTNELLKTFIDAGYIEEKVKNGNKNKFLTWKGNEEPIQAVRE